jgi:AbrB family looped-hinge helix DNA binding protein
MAVKVSPKFQIVLTQAVRKQLKLKPGMELEQIVWGNGVYIIPVRPLSEARGMLKGMDTTLDRSDFDREL